MALLPLTQCSQITDEARLTYSRHLALVGYIALEGRGTKEGAGALTSPQGSPGRSTPEAGSRSESCHEDSWCAAEGRGRGGH